ncbi:hypothetical protein J2X20_000082 [Pelomonas saccharophila]|uniref:DUF4902 domain-containing protein n=1 Tax=Roseateles saccharophilus TaxID=304 RepID=A0ABU1YF25_ROSSA|nr:hypothetical protein [Roseateles saccharophilus]MDR7267453.1 hypothetical protein [Roseateles saccharophilus]
MPTLIQLPEGSVCWPVAALSSAAQDVRHAQTHVHRSRGGEGRLGGSTRWERCYADSCAWVEWDWVSMGDGAVAQADPLNVRSNVLLLDDRGRPLLSSRRRATLATLVYLLPWQGPVLDKLRSSELLHRAAVPMQRLAA